MRRLFNSLTFQLLLVTIMGTSLVVSSGLIGWQGVIHLSELSADTQAAEDQEVLLLNLAPLVTNAADFPDERDNFDGQIRTLITTFESAQVQLNQDILQAPNDPARLQVISTLDDTNQRWEETRSLLEEFLATSSDSARLGLENEIHQKIINLGVYANRTSEALQAVAERERQATLRGFAMVAVVTAATVVLIVSVMFRVARSMQGLSLVARAYSGGEYSHRADTNTLNEVAALGTTFNQMADSIQQREDDLRESNATLEKRVQERTADLERANVEIREASRAKDEFLSVMSHELRTPLNAILGYQGILELMGVLEGENLSMVQRTQANARRLLELINDVLDISRIEAGRMEIIPTDVPVRDFIQRIQDQMTVLAAEKNLGFEVTIGDTVPAIINTDEDALHKIVVNLLGNAFKFTDDGHVSLTVKQEANFLMMTVTDTGMGIPSHMQNVIFERFRQVDSTSTRSHGGSGLGLSIVQQICQLLGGQVRVESEVGMGSSFIVTLPIQGELTLEPQSVTPAVEVAYE